MGAGASVGDPSSCDEAGPVHRHSVTGSAVMGGASYYIEPSKVAKENVKVEVSQYGASAVALPRGGILVPYSKGSIQFGLPPETIKDSLLWGLDVPTTFVIMGDEMFDRQLGINIAEFEFPAYFNFFVRKRCVTLITTKAVEKRVRKIFQETLLGPKEGTYDLSQDFSNKLPGGNLTKQNQDTHWPDFVLEGLALDEQREHISVDALLNFEIFDKTAQDVVRKPTSESLLSDSGEVLPDLCKIGKVVLDEATGAYVKYNPIQKKFVVREGKRTIAQTDHRFLKPRRKMGRSVKHEPFDFPIFGITMLGTSHGFDPLGTTTGFVIWVNRRGIMVDPPPDSAEVLEDMGIPASVIDGMILTHCHADHDAGAFQKILAEASIKIYTTQTIMDSFIRKYSAISNLNADFLRGLFVFKRVTIGEEMEIHGGRWSFHYSLHVIPTIGFEVKFANEGIVYSGDTCTSYKVFEKMRREKKIGKGRYDDLMKRSPLARQLPGHRNQNGDYIPPYKPHILHEAGVPPIHTPLETLAKLSPEVRDRLFVVHVDAKSLANTRNPKNLKSVPQWSTLRIDVELAHEHVIDSSSLKVLVESISIFKPLRQSHQVEKLLECGQERFYAKGTHILKTGETWDKVYLVRAGVALERTDRDPSGATRFSSAFLAESAGTNINSIRRSSLASTVSEQEESSGSLPRRLSIASANEGEFFHQLNDSLKSCHKPTTYSVANLFGEQSLLPDGENGRNDRRVNYEVVAKTPLFTLEFNRADLLEVLSSSAGGRKVLGQMVEVARASSLATWDLIRMNDTLERIMTKTQKQEMQKMLTDERNFEEQEVIFAGGEKQTYMFFVADGILSIQQTPPETKFSSVEVQHDRIDVGPGSLIGDVNSLKDNTIAHYQLDALTKSTLYFIKKNQVVNFLNRFPGIKLQCIDRTYII